jgi:Flp pilus assembly protein TadB
VKIAENLFLFIGQKAHNFFPKLERQLESAQMDKGAEEYLSSCAKNSLKLSVPVSSGLFVIALNLNDSLFQLIAAVSFPVVLMMGFFTFVSIPNIRTKRRTRKLEKNLPYALRDILIQINSGIPLYQAMVTATEGYGEASKELNRIVRDVDGGKSMVVALEESIVRNPSERYRRAMWQLSNSIRSGTDISGTLSSVVDAIIKEQKIEIEKYGEELNPYILVYLLVAVIGPALGITGLIVISSFTGTAVNFQLYVGILFGLVVIQVFFLNLIKSKRPEVRS